MPVVFRPRLVVAALLAASAARALAFLGEEKDGFEKVQDSDGDRWVKKTLVSKK